MRWVLLWFALCGLALGAVSEGWFAAKAAVGSATREALYATLPKLPRYSLKSPSSLDSR